MACNYRAPQLVDFALIYIKTTASLYDRHGKKDDSPISLYRDNTAYNAFFFQCVLVDADTEKVLSVAKAIRRHERRHGVCISPCSLDAGQLRQFFAKELPA